MTHCLQDDNVKPDQFSECWYGLAANNVARKLWLCREGHIDPFMTRRTEWMNQLHQWFDYWLFGVQNGIMSQPRVDIENTKDNWAATPTGRCRARRTSTSSCRATRQRRRASSAARRAGDRHAALDGPREPERGDGDEHRGGTTQNNRRMFLSPVLKSDLRVSGTPQLTLRLARQAAVEPQRDARRLRPEHADHAFGRRHLDAGQRAQRLLGPSSTRIGPNGQVMDFDACYQIPTKPTVTVTATQGWRISRGILDSNNRDSLYADVTVTPGAEYEFKFPILPVDYTIPAGHRVGVVLMANFSDLERNGTTGTAITLNSKLSKISLPVVGGYNAMVAAGALEADTVAPVFPAAPPTSTRRRATRPARTCRSRCRPRPTTRTRTRS